MHHAITVRQTAAQTLQLLPEHDEQGAVIHRLHIRIEFPHQLRPWSSLWHMAVFARN